ncbi:MAG TPA: response regulator transcription factor [Clostridia bacterium]
MEERKYTILLADDEKEIVDLLSLYLENAGLSVIGASNGREALDVLCRKDVKIDAAVLDIMMPEMDGYTLVRKIREASNIPILILSARSDDSGKIFGLDLGADDYITKPFNPLEITARVQAQLRRYYRLNTPPSEAADRITAGELVLDREGCTLTKNGRDIPLTAVEFRILCLLMESRGKVFTKSRIYEHVWGGDFYESDDNTIMVHISKLRDKIEDDPRNPRYLKTVRGIGYRFEKEKQP